MVNVKFQNIMEKMVKIPQNVKQVSTPNALRLLKKHIGNQKEMDKLFLYSGATRFVKPIQECSPLNTLKSENILPKHLLPDEYMRIYSTKIRT